MEQDAVGTLADTEITYNLYFTKHKHFWTNDCVRNVAEISLVEA